MRTIAAAAVAALLLAGPAHTAQGRPAVHHYSRPETVLACTRTKGCWLFRCHDVKTPSPHVWLPGGCLPPKRVS